MRSVLFAVFAALAISVCGNRGGQGRPGKFPSFLRNVTEEGRKSYFAITTNKTITFAAQTQAVQAWAQQNGVTAEVSQFQANMTKYRNDLNTNITQLISQLSAGQQQLNQIIQNQNQTPVQQQQAIMNFRNQSRNVYETLRYMSRLFSPKGNRGPMGGFNGRDVYNGRGNFNGRNDFDNRGGFNNGGGQGFNSFKGQEGFGGHLGY